MTAKVLMIVYGGIVSYSIRGDAEVRCLDFDTDGRIETEQDFEEFGVTVGGMKAYPGTTEDMLADEDFLDQWELAGVGQ